jgi:hypothetical protein
MSIFDPTWQETPAGFEWAMPRVMMFDVVLAGIALGFLGYAWLLGLPLMGWGVVAFILLIRAFGTLLRGPQVTALHLTDTTYTLYTAGRRKRLLRQGPLSEVNALKWEVDIGRHGRETHYLRLRIRDGAWYWLGQELPEIQIQRMYEALSAAILARLDAAHKERFDLGKPPHAS